MDGDSLTQISWSEQACLVRSRRPDDGSCIDREIVIEGSFAEVARTFSHYRVDTWHELTISFVERRRPPFRYEQGDFSKYVVSRLLSGIP
jgi:hypothetical protein